MRKAASPMSEETGPEAVTEELTFIPSEEIRRLWTCAECGDQYISPNALATHHREEHG